MNGTSEKDCEQLRVLVVEDHEDTAEITAQFLRTLNYSVETAASVEAALGAAASEEFHLIISDIELPDGTGIDLMRKLRLRGPIKGIAMSGYGRDADVRQSREAGFLDHLTKPVDLPTLMAAIQRVGC